MELFDCIHGGKGTMSGMAHSTIFMCAAVINAAVTLSTIGAWKNIQIVLLGMNRRVRNRQHDTILENNDHDDHDKDNDDKKTSFSTNNFFFGWKKNETRNHSHTTSDVQESKFQHTLLIHRYLKVYCLASFADWLQGPYIYHLYEQLGYSSYDIAILFVVGYGSSMCLGSVIAGMADNSGRRKFVVIFSITYSLSCICKHFSNFTILLVGRILGGIASSLLFSVFDAWLIRAHSDAGLDKSYLSSSFSLATYCKFFIAILAGLIGNKVAGSNEIKQLEFFSHEVLKKGKLPDPSQKSLILKGGCINVFDLAMVCAIASGLLAICLWEENYGTSHQDTKEEQVMENKHKDIEGNENISLLSHKSKSIEKIDSHGNKDLCKSMKDAMKIVFSSVDILICGIVTALFEGSLFVFVFLWTPALSEVSKENDTSKTDSMSTDDAKSQLGLIFATFMVSCMTGSSLYSILKGFLKDEVIGIYVMLFASSSLLMVAGSFNSTVTTISFNIFEMCVGVYFPMIGTLKSEFVPEKQRVIIYNIFRIPLNMIVLFTLLTSSTPKRSFIGCSTMLFFASVFLLILSRRRNVNMNDDHTNIESSEDQCGESDEIKERLNGSFIIEEKKGRIERHLTHRHTNAV